jgi:uncharacterized membrane protein YvlD (DUF360 family)
MTYSLKTGLVAKTSCTHVRDKHRSERYCFPMTNILQSAAGYFLAAFIGIFAADMLLPGFHVDGGWAYIVVPFIFALIMALVSPIVTKTLEKNAPILMGGVSLIASLVTLAIVNLLFKGISLDDFGSWIGGAAIIWLFGALAAFILPMFLKKTSNV